MYSLALRSVLVAAQGPVAGQTYRAEELNRPNGPIAGQQLVKSGHSEDNGQSEVDVRYTERRADDFKLRLKLRKAEIAAEKEKRRVKQEAEEEAVARAEVEARFAAEDAVAAATRPVREQPADPYANMDFDFDFEGDGRPFRFARGRSARVVGGKEGVRLARAQLRGEEPMKLVQRDGILRHTGPTTPFGGLGVSGLLGLPTVRTELRDYVVGWLGEALKSGSSCWGEEGLHYASFGSDKLLFDLELLERIRALGVHISQVCLIDPKHEELSRETKQALREFADWQRATAQVSREEPAEILAFASLEDYHEASAAGSRAAGCHLFMHCQALWGESVVLDRRRQMIRGMVAGGLFVRLINDYSQKQASAKLDEPTSAEAWFSMGAWMIAPGKPPSITPIRKSNYAGVLGAIADTAASSVRHAMQAEEARARAQKEKAQTAMLQRKLQEEQAREAEAQQVTLKQQAQGHMAPVPEVEEEEDLVAWRAVFRPQIAVREAPRRTARIVGALYPGEEVHTLEEKRVENWLCISRAPVRPPGAEIPKEAWVLASSGDGYVFLEPV